MAPINTSHPPAPVAGIVLAAGRGRRHGGPKALALWHGRRFVEIALETLRTSGCHPAVVVLGAAADQIQRETDLTGASLVTNPLWPLGMGSSLRAGLAALATTPACATVVLLVDTPGVTPAAAARVMEHASPDALATATYLGHPGHPVLLGREHWPAVAAQATGDAGARQYLRDHASQTVRVECGDVSDGRDIDFCR